MLKKDRTRSSVKGLGNLRIRETSPVNATAFDTVGSLDGDTGTTLENFVDVEEIVPETGVLEDVKEKTEITRLSTNLLQTSIDEINLNKTSSGKTYALRYFGKHSENHFQYFCAPKAKLNPGVSLGFRNEKRVLPFKAWALKQQELAYNVPDIYIAETQKEIYTDNLELWINPRSVLPYNVGTSKILDISGFERHGNLLNGASVVPGVTPENALVTDGVNDYVDFGDIFNVPLGENLLLETWIKIPSRSSWATNGNIIGKGFNFTQVGYFIIVNSSAFLQIIVRDTLGTSITITTSVTSPIIYATWYYISVLITSSKIKVYINGILREDQSVVFTSDISNSYSLIIGNNSQGANPINIYNGTVRIYKNIPLTTGIPETIIAQNYAAEKSYYGL